MIIVAVVVVIGVVAGVGAYVVVSRGGGGGGENQPSGGVLGTLPVYSGAQETNDTIAQQAITSCITGMGSPSGWAGKAYTTTADPQTVIDWYRTQMSGWTKTFDNTMQEGGMTTYVLGYTKGSDGAVILTFSAVSNYLILAAGPNVTI